MESTELGGILEAHYSQNVREKVLEQLMYVPDKENPNAFFQEDVLLFIIIIV